MKINNIYIITYCYNSDHIGFGVIGLTITVVLYANLLFVYCSRIKYINSNFLNTRILKSLLPIL